MRRKHPEYEHNTSPKRRQQDIVSPRPPHEDSAHPASSSGARNALLVHHSADEGDINRLLGLSLPQQPSMIHSSTVDKVGQSPTDLARSLLLEPSFQRPSQPFDIQPSPTNLPQLAMLDSNAIPLDYNQGIPDRLSPHGQASPQDHWSPTTLQITRGCELFFHHVSKFVPFLHQPTFDATRLPPYLILSMLCLAYQYGEDPESDQVGSGASLSTFCFHRARSLVTSDSGSTDNVADKVAMVQSYLLLQICAMMYLCGENSPFGLKMHFSMISIARSGGMMQPLSVQSAATQDLESLWREFIQAESHKRTVFAVHQIDALWYQFLSIPRSISHLEIKHDLPCPEDQWTASSSAEWAHRQLVTRHAGPAVQYADAVRRFLSSDEDLNLIPPFDPYGAINIAQFLISSAREISGWSTMTGMVSMERFGALRSSLATLSPFIRPQLGTSHSTHGALCAATWETAMLELQMWSPSHTGGIVEASIDAVLSQSAYLAPDCEFLCEANTAKAIQPHIDWFLRYLDETLVPDCEAPWIALYAYKAFLIAWQLVQKGISGAMQAVGIRDSDVDGALMWARGVFQRRQKWQLGKLILASLDELGRRDPFVDN